MRGINSRVATALVLGLGLLLTLWFRSYQAMPWPWNLCVAIFAGLAMLEWAGLSDPRPRRKALFMLVFLAVTAGALWLTPQDFYGLLVTTVGLWGLMLLRVVIGTRWKQWDVWLLTALGVLALPVVVVLMVRMTTLDILVVLMIVAATDIGGYEIGRRYGRKPLAPELSPNKTRGGLIGSLGCVAILALGGSWALGLGTLGGIVMLVLALLCACFAVVGDLAESLFKRRAGVKDSGSILPGHGGMLDRIDSLLAAAPMYALGMLVMGREIF